MTRPGVVLFGLVTLDRQPKKAHAAMQELWRAENE
jgi:hypothetical protein